MRKTFDRIERAIAGEGLGLSEYCYIAVLLYIFVETESFDYTKDFKWLSDITFVAHFYYIYYSVYPKTPVEIVEATATALLIMSNW